LLRADIEFSEISRAKGSAAAFYQFLVSEAIFLQSGEPPVRGSETIRVRMAAGPQGILTWTPMYADVSLKGDMGYTWGSYEFRGKNGDRRVSYGKYVNVWKKQQDKSWKVVLASQTASPDLPLRRNEAGNSP
jgi:ketosteroid isomerase-like protein